ncbi:ABC transporter ATP-binding protein [Oceaniferula spumae]|uniref:ABC transporter ATP-binding protein n=1 Tax=Oceaniferula spumae TaxID=2979115 RepID=A0AAT9FPI5_9BACT
MHIELDQICKQYGQETVYNQLSAEIEAGTLLCVLGVNGSGKTTLLRMLAGMAGRDSGDLRFDGESALRDNISQRLKLCFLPDFPVLFTERTPLENIAIFIKLWQVETPPPHEEIINLLEELDLLAHCRKPINKLSRGQMFKVALACLIIVNPELWLIDEPFASGMDPQGISVFKKHAKLAVERGHTVIYSTQLLELAEKFSSRIWVVHNGGLAADGTALELAENSGDLESLFNKLREQ